MSMIEQLATKVKLLAELLELKEMTVETDVMIQLLFEEINNDRKACIEFLTDEELQIEIALAEKELAYMREHPWMEVNGRDEVISAKEEALNAELVKRGLNVGEVSIVAVDAEAVERGLYHLREL